MPNARDQLSCDPSSPKNTVPTVADIFKGENANVVAEKNGFTTAVYPQLPSFAEKVLAHSGQLQRAARVRSGHDFPSKWNRNSTRPVFQRLKSLEHCGQQLSHTKHPTPWYAPTIKAYKAWL